jgi:ATP-binding cassette, subfamily B, bacterial MsbA
MTRKNKKSISVYQIVNSNRSTIRRLLNDHVSNYWGLLALAIFMMSLVAATTAAMAWSMEYVLDEVFTAKNKTLLPYVGGAIFLLFFVKGMSSYAQSILMNHVGQSIVCDIQKQMFKHLIYADLTFYHNTSTGALVARFTNDVQLLRSSVSTSLTGIGKDALTVIFLVAVMFQKDLMLASIAFFIFPTAVFPIARLSKKMRKASSTTQEKVGGLASLLDQVFQGVRHVKAYGMEMYEVMRANKIIDSVFKSIQKAARAKAITHPLMELLGGVAIVAVIFYGGYQVIQGTQTTGTFFAFITALLLAYEPMKRLAHINADLQEGIAAATRIFELMDIQPKIQNQVHAKPLIMGEGQVIFQGVNFAYRKEHPVLRDLNLTLEGGKTTALVGPSGSGKSTLLNLIPRFYEIQEGAIAIDRQNIQDLTLESLRKHIALVSQEVSLFDDTIYANIAYGRLDATEAEIYEAAKMAAAHDFIQGLPEGYQTMVGEQGVKLSGGQRQRISIARAILKNAPILLLDEATSALDAESEKLIQEALQKLMNGRTTLVIAHRLSTILHADQIVVLDKGLVVEKGTHKALLEEKGLYARIYNLQFQEMSRME